jgi:hypothetical protein
VAVALSVRSAVGRSVDRFRSLAGIFDFFIPAEVLSSVLLVFTMENVLDHAFANYIPADFQAAGWIAVYVLGVLAISGLNYVTADEEELEDLSDDFEEF